MRRLDDAIEDTDDTASVASTSDSKSKSYKKVSVKSSTVQDDSDTLVENDIKIDNNDDSDASLDTETDRLIPQPQPIHKKVIFDEEDEEFEKQREEQRAKLEAEAEEAERLANPTTYLDMIRAEDAEMRSKGAKGSRRNRHIEQEAELSDDDDAVGLDQYGIQNQ